MTDRERRLTDDDLYTDERHDEVHVDDGPGAGTAGGALGGAAAGAIAGTVIGGPIGTAVGAAIGAVGGAALGYAADATADDGIPPDPTADVTTAGTGAMPGAGIGAPIVPLVGGPGGIGVGAVGLPTASSELDEADVERRGAGEGAFDNPASYDETAAEVARERPILVGDDPGFQAVRTPERTLSEAERSRIYIADRDDLDRGAADR